jgi:uncharacterized membrane protein
MQPMHQRFQLEPHQHESHDFLITGLTMLFWTAVIFGLVVLISHLVRRHAQQIHQDPLDIAKARYAKGDITKEEFSQLKKELA